MNVIASAKKADIAVGAQVLLRGEGCEIVIANIDGRYAAFESTCSHAGGPLALGEISGTVVECPWHGARFDVFTGAPIDGTAKLPIAVYEVRVAGEDVIVGESRSRADAITTFQNDLGNSEIVVNVASFSCVGATPPNDHPHVFLRVGVGGTVDCPYCASRFRLDPGAIRPSLGNVLVGD